MFEVIADAMEAMARSITAIVTAIVSLLVLVLILYFALVLYNAFHTLGV